MASYLQLDLGCAIEAVGLCIRKQLTHIVFAHRFHLVEPQADLPVTLPQSQLSQLVVSRSKRTVPYPILGENTLVLSDSMVLTEDAGELALMFR